MAKPVRAMSASRPTGSGRGSFASPPRPIASGVSKAVAMKNLKPASVIGAMSSSTDLVMMNVLPHTTTTTHRDAIARVRGVMPVPRSAGCGIRGAVHRIQVVALVPGCVAAVEEVEPRGRVFREVCIFGQSFFERVGKLRISVQHLARDLFGDIRLHVL